MENEKNKTKKVFEKIKEMDLDEMVSFFYYSNKKRGMAKTREWLEEEYQDPREKILG